jgi:hypothetical protein
MGEGERELEDKLVWNDTVSRHKNMTLDSLIRLKILHKISDNLVNFSY